MLLPPIGKSQRIFLPPKTWLIMRLMILMLTFFVLRVSATGYGQRLSVSYNNTPLNRVFKDITEKTGYLFFYSFVETDPPKNVTYTKTNGTLEDVLNACFKGQPYRYQVIEKTVVVKYKAAQKEMPTLEQPLFHDVKGKVMNDKGEPVPGATITVKGTRTVVTANANGEFAIVGIAPDAVLVVSGAELEKIEIQVAGRKDLIVTTKQILHDLDDPIVIGYGTTTRRYSTGNVSKVRASEIASQPVSNPLAALQGRVAGLVVNSTGGAPGSSFTVQLRGQNSLNPNVSGVLPLDQPLFIIDGVPIAAQNGNINLLTSVASPGVNDIFANPYGGISPFNNINPADIESIEVLKDADATAIYGSRAANGVILISTKKGTTGKTKFSFNVQSGSSRISRLMEMLGTSDYLVLRREAFANDGVIPSNTLSPAYAPDLFFFDSTRNVDWVNSLIKNSSAYNDISVSASGGNSNTQFLIGMGYHRENFIYPGDFINDRISSNFNIRHTSLNKKFTINLSSNFSHNNTNNTANSVEILRLGLTLPPNFPDLMNADGELEWEYKTAPIIENPLAYLKQKYILKSKNLISNLLLSYKILPSLVIQTNVSYNNMTTDENSQRPQKSVNPLYNPGAFSYFGATKNETYILEPQLEYRKRKGLNEFNGLIGYTFQERNAKGMTVQGTGYQDDALLGSISAAANKFISDSYSLYRYTGVFARFIYTRNNKYVFSLNGRRDGSSRFGPGNQFGNFGAVGVAWIFSNENYIKKNIPFLSFGKLRFSYGSTGSDGIGDYSFIPRWGAGNTSYQGSLVYNPQNLFNPELKWSQTNKLDMSMDLSFLENRLNLNLAYYRNESSNQLISERIPVQTGFNTITTNFPALVRNTGFEMAAQTTNIKSKTVVWTTSFNITLSPKNILVTFPDLENSSYRNVYTIGEPISRLRKYISLGVNPTSGIYEFKDLNNDGIINADDMAVIGSTNPRYYGGLGNIIAYKGFTLDFFFEFRKQTGANYLQQIYSSNPPGTQNNLPIEFLARWNDKHTDAAIGKLTTSSTTPAGKANIQYSNSDAVYTDASFVRLKTLALSYQFNNNALRKMNLDNARFYINAQNLFVFTKYRGHDPETQSFYGIPPLRTIVVGFQLNF
ncbi:MAG: SusC/RagA family TonB-linked outer membrane protein [Agriterribacter sp.]